MNSEYPSCKLSWWQSSHSLPVCDVFSSLWRDMQGKTSAWKQLHPCLCWLYWGRRVDTQMRLDCANSALCVLIQHKSESLKNKITWKKWILCYFYGECGTHSTSSCSTSAGKGPGGMRWCGAAEWNVSYLNAQACVMWVQRQTPHFKK